MTITESKIIVAKYFFEAALINSLSHFYLLFTGTKCFKSVECWSLSQKLEFLHHLLELRFIKRKCTRLRPLYEKITKEAIKSVRYQVSLKQDGGENTL